MGGRSVALLAALLLACSAEVPVVSSTPTLGPSAVTSQGGCAPPLRPLTPTTATVTLLPHQVGQQTIFGLDGAFLASAYGYPLGAFRRWWELDASGGKVRDFEWPLLRSSVLQSPGGAQVAYLETDPATGGPTLYVREMKGVPRLLATRGRLPYAWLDDDRMLFGPDAGAGIVHAVDTWTGADQMIFRPPPPPSLPSGDVQDSFDLSGDARWAIFTRSTKEGATVPTASWLAPRGDVLVWLEGSALRAMHLCDGRKVTLATLTPAAAPMYGGIRWSGDARYLSFSFGLSDETHGPERTVVVDLQRGVLAEIADPWGMVWRSSPDDAYVILARYGYHATTNRIARISIP